MLDRTQRRGSGTPVVAGDLDHIGIGLRHTSRDRPDPNLSHQLHTDRRFGMHLVQIMDELSKILNGIDVVVGRG